MEEHVGTCRVCQRSLQELVGGLPSTLGAAVPRASRADEEPPELAGYELEGRLDAGGMGVVWRVRDRAFDRALAVKVLKSGLSGRPGAIRRFLAEARITGQLSHPSVVPVHAAGLLPDGRPYFTMKLVEGDTLAALLRRPDAPSRHAHAVRIFTQVCQAVAHAHARGVIHRDLKPDNVMVGAFGEVQVMDWGLAKEVRGAECGVPDEGDDTTNGTDSSIPLTDETRPGAVMGTLPYMPPEQARGEVARLGPRCDVFNLGAILCEILTGEPPYNSALRGELMHQASRGELGPAFARLDACGADRELVELAKSCLAPEPEDRPPDAAAVADAAVAYQLGAEERLRRAEVERAEAQVRSREERRRRRLATGLAAVVLAALAGLAVGAGLLDRKNRQLVTANGQLDSARAEAEAKGGQAARARDRAFEALDTMTSRVTGESLETQAAISPEQRRFLKKVLTYYEEFAREQGDDEATRRRVAFAAHRVGFIHARLGDQEAGLRALAQARDAYRKLAADFPAAREYRQRQARCANNMGALLREMGRTREAEEAVREGLALREQLAAESAAPEYREELAAGYNNLGVLLRDPSRHAEAETALRKSLQLREALVADFPAEPRYRQQLATSHNNVALALARRGADPAAAIRQSMAIREKLAADRPSVPLYRQDLGDSHSHLADALREQGRPAEAAAALRASLTIREKLATDFPAVPQYRHDLAGAHHSLGVLLQAQGKRAEAAAAYRRAVAELERLATDSPAVPQYRIDLAGAHHDLAVLLRGLGKGAEAEQSHRRALELQEKLVADHPAAPSYRHDLAGSRYHLGLLLHAQRKLADAEAAFRQALAHRKKLAADHPAVAEYRQVLATTYHSLGLLLKDAGKLEDAEAAYRESLELQEKLVAEFPHALAYRTKLAGTHVNHGGVVSKGGRPGESLKSYDRAIALLGPVVRAEPRLGAERQVLQTAHWARALALDKLGRPADAIADWDRAAELAAADRRPGVRAVRARSLVRAGRVEQAVAEADDLAESPPTPDLLYDLACVYALASVRDEPNRESHAAKALRMLQGAAAHGYRDAEQVKKDDDFQSLRGRSEFRQLVLRMGGSARPPEKGR